MPVSDFPKGGTNVAPEDLGHQQHILNLTNRDSLTLTGVVHVDAFDDQEIAVDTELGSLTIRGENLHIRQLSLEEGKLGVEGMVDAMAYGPRARGKMPRARGRGWLERLFR
jgi:sporulation protein YabP